MLKYLIIRAEEPADYKNTELMTMRSFFNKYGPGANEHFLIRIIRESKDYLPQISRIAEVDGKIVGVGSVRSGNRLSLLFVAKEFHKYGIGTELIDRLCRYLRDICHENSMIVKAAPYAVEFYKKIGFLPLEPEKNISGIRVTTMELIF